MCQPSILLDVTVESNLGWSIHINNILSQAMQRFYLLRQIYVHERRCSWQCFRVTCHQPHQLCSPCFANSLSKDDSNKINALLRKYQKWGMNSELYIFCALRTSQYSAFHKNAVPWSLSPPSDPPIRPPPSYAIGPNVHQFNTPKLNSINSFIHRNFT